jgi:SAM-dependent methyltransferase
LKPAIPDRVSETGLNEEARLEGLATVRMANNDKIVRFLADHKLPGKRLLDVGSGLGFFLRTAAEAGFQVSGIEPDANVVEKARQGGFEVRHGYFPDCLASTERFDVIVFNDVLEHVVDLDAVMASVRHYLNPQGIVVFNSPDRSGVFYRIANVLDAFGVHGPFDRLWQRDVPSPHMWYFTKDDLFRIGGHYGLAKCGTVQLKTISLRGLADRVFYFEKQSKLVSIGGFLAALAMLPVLRLLPSDLGVAILQKPAEHR